RSSDKLARITQRDVDVANDRWPPLNSSNGFLYRLIRTSRENEGEDEMDNCPSRSDFAQHDDARLYRARVYRASETRPSRQRIAIVSENFAWFCPAAFAAVQWRRSF